MFQITEKGTEAAAATSAFVFRMAPTNVMQFDRPFFLFIYDALNKVSMSMNSILEVFGKTKEYPFLLFVVQVVLFWARVVEPEPIIVNLE